MSTRAVYGGSFDPVHLGHLAMIEIAARTHDELIVVVLANTAKTSGLFPPGQRVDLIHQTLAHLRNVSVTAYHGLIVDAAQSLDADVLVRSAHKEGRHERSMAAMNTTPNGHPDLVHRPTRIDSIDLLQHRTAARRSRPAGRCHRTCPAASRQSTSEARGEMKMRRSGARA